VKRKSLIVPLLLASGLALAEDVPAAKPAAPPEEQAKKPAAPEPEAPATEEDRSLGMSVLGNQEAPKALVIVPWKGSVIGDSVGISTMLDDSKLPIDREVFMRALGYYEVRSTTMAGPSDAAQPASAAHRR
jgi:hypothetical protein